MTYKHNDAHSVGTDVFVALFLGNSNAHTYTLIHFLYVMAI